MVPFIFIDGLAEYNRPPQLSVYAAVASKLTATDWLMLVQRVSRNSLPQADTQQK